MKIQVLDKLNRCHHYEVDDKTGKASTTIIDDACVYCGKVLLPGWIEATQERVNYINKEET